MHVMQSNMFHSIQRSMLTGVINLFRSKTTQVGKFLTGREWKVMAGILIGLGIILRLIPYLHNRSLWLDENWLVLNIIQKTFPQLMGPLDYKQMAPVGFLFVEKFLALTFGDSEYVLRFFPLLAGILSLFLFYGVARRILTLRGLTISLGLFSISGYLLRYSSELKQYSSDVAIALGIYLLGLLCIEKESRFVLSVSLFSIAGAILIWFSHPAIFSLAGVGVALALYCLNARKWQQVAWLSLPACFWLGSFALNYFLILDVSQSPKMVKAWSGSTDFMPLSPLSVEDLMWYPKVFFNMFLNPGGLPFYGLAAFCFVIGWVSAFLEKQYICYMLTFPFLFTLMASGLYKYPFVGRLILFLVPAMMIFIGEGVDRIMTLMKPTAWIVWVSLCALLFLFPVQNAVFNVLDPGRMEREEVRPLIGYFSQNYREGDRLYLYHSSWTAFLYYAKRFGLEDVPYQLGVTSKNNWDRYIQELRGLRGNDRVWILFSHVHKKSGIDEEKFFLFYLDKMGTRVDSFKRKGASLYLYNLESNSSNKEILFEE